MNEQSKSESQQNVLQISFSPAQMSTEKSYKQIKMKEIIFAACALLNSNGGELRLEFDKDTGNELNQDVIDNCIRMMEQWFISIIGVTTMASRIKLSVKPHEILIEIQESDKLVIVNYNLYLPSKSQVLAVPPTEPPEAIENILQSQMNIVEREDVPIGSHLKTFKKDQNTGLVEDSNTEFKNLRTAPTKHVTFADRLAGKSNKLTSYVSGFANYCGGHIYYGINDAGVVKGESINDEKDEIIKKVAKTINKMVWPQNSSPPQRGEQWDIFFESVRDENNNVIPSTFVIVLYIAPCPGGVFVDEPESYHLVEGKVQKISFLEWRRHFSGVSRHAALSPVPSHLPRVQWSSVNNRDFYRKLSQTFVQHRNNGERTAFSSLSELAKEKFPTRNVEQIIKTEEIVVAYKHHCFRKSDSLLSELATDFPNSTDSFIFEGRRVHLLSMNERSKGNYEISNEIAHGGVQIMHQIPIDLYTVWFYIQFAMITIITMLTEKQDSQSYRSKKDEALRHLELAARYAKSPEDLLSTRSDLEQEWRIYKAWALLECAITGEEQNQHSLSEKDIEAAAKELALVHETVLKGHPLTHFRKTQYHLAKCDLFRRRSELSQENYFQNLKQAFKCGSKARNLARKHRFASMVVYANKRLADVTEKLVRHAVHTRGRHADRTFMGFVY